MDPNAKLKMTVEQLQETAQYRKLTPKLQLWITTYLQSWLDLGTPDMRLATQSAFDSDGENARTLGYKTLRNKKIQACLSLIQRYGKQKRDIFLDGLEAEIAATKPGSAARSRLLATFASVAFRRHGDSIVSNRSQKFNRSSALSPKTLAVITTEGTKAAQDAVEAFMHNEAYKKLSDEGRAEAIDRLANGITEGLAKFVESVKPQLCALD